MKKILLFSVLTFSIAATSQTLNQVYKIDTPDAANQFRQGYTFAYASSGTPWNGSLISFGGLYNNYDLQINSDYGPNGGNKISFRTRNGDMSLWNPWRELVSKNSDGIIEMGDIVSGGSNSWMFHSPDDGRSSLYIAPLLSTGNYDWAHAIVLNKGNMALINGKLEAKEIKVTTTPTADFVFEENYQLPSLESVEKYIKEKKHLPEIASAKEMEKEGVNIGEFQIKLLQKIEELTLYTIEQNKLLKEQSEKIKNLESRLNSK